MTNTMKDVETMKGDQMKTSISVYNVSTNGTIVTFEMSNNGFTKIENFSQMDIIMTFSGRCLRSTRNQSVLTRT